MQEENFNETEEQNSKENSWEEESSGGFKQWFQDNLRIILSVIVVVAIAGGIYSYSKQSPQQNNGSEIASQIETEEQQNQEEANVTEEEKANEEVSETEKATAENKEEKAGQETEKKVSATQTEKISQETEKSFIETAQKGEGLTHLARRALADYLEKNPDSELKAEQKIYIEDYLRKHVGFNKRIYPGTSVEFSKDLIKEAINQSKQLTPAQIKNLHKYVVRVPSLK